ncbi:hypothetical protein DFH28DRAFT_928707 [Melampsora americana]|nr:hypothetical protein DFH28DRAFT_928707 [Melampsora americana]
MYFPSTILELTPQGGFCSLETALRTSGLQTEHRLPGDGVTRSPNSPQNSRFLRPGNPSSFLQKNQYQPLAPHLSVPKRVSNMCNNTMADSTNQHMNVVLATLPQCNSSKPSPCPRSGRNCQELLRPSQTISGQPMLCLQTACAEGGLQTAKPSRGVVEFSDGVILIATRALYLEAGRMNWSRGENKGRRTSKITK